MLLRAICLFDLTRVGFFFFSHLLMRCSGGMREGGEEGRKESDVFV